MGKYTNEFKKEVVNYYFTSQSGYRHTASHFGIARSNVRTWVQNYKYCGPEALNTRNHHVNYSHSFKMQILKVIFEEGLSLREASNRFNLCNTGTVSQWLSKNNNSFTS